VRLVTFDLSQPFKRQKEMHALFLQMAEKGVSSNVHPLWDRDEVHDIYKEWRKVLDAAASVSGEDAR
jgi:alpha-glucosidase